MSVGSFCSGTEMYAMVHNNYVHIDVPDLWHMCTFKLFSYLHSLSSNCHQEWTRTTIHVVSYIPLTLRVQDGPFLEEKGFILRDVEK